MPSMNNAIPEMFHPAKRVKINAAMSSTRFVTCLRLLIEGNHLSRADVVALLVWAMDSENEAVMDFIQYEYQSVMLPPHGESKWEDDVLDCAHKNLCMTALQLVDQQRKYYDKSFNMDANRKLSVANRRIARDQDLEAMREMSTSSARAIIEAAADLGHMEFCLKAVDVVAEQHKDEIKVYKRFEKDGYTLWEMDRIYHMLSKNGHWSGGFEDIMGINPAMKMAAFTGDLILLDKAVQDDEHRCVKPELIRMIIERGNLDILELVVFCPLILYGRDLPRAVEWSILFFQLPILRWLLFDVDDVDEMPEAYRYICDPTPERNTAPAHMQFSTLNIDFLTKAAHNGCSDIVSRILQCTGLPTRLFRLELEDWIEDPIDVPVPRLFRLDPEDWIEDPINVPGLEALLEAAMMGHADITQMLIQQWQSNDTRDETQRYNVGQVFNKRLEMMVRSGPDNRLENFRTFVSGIEALLTALPWLGASIRFDRLDFLETGLPEALVWAQKYYTADPHQLNVSETVASIVKTTNEDMMLWCLKHPQHQLSSTDIKSVLLWAARYNKERVLKCIIGRCDDNEDLISATLEAIVHGQGKVFQILVMRLGERELNKLMRTLCDLPRQRSLIRRIRNLGKCVFEDSIKKDIVRNVEDVESLILKRIKMLTKRVGMRLARRSVPLVDAQGGL